MSGTLPYYPCAQPRRGRKTSWTATHTKQHGELGCFVAEHTAASTITPTSAHNFMYQCFQNGQGCAGYQWRTHYYQGLLPLVDKAMRVTGHPTNSHRQQAKE
jgi:hypothetical protein